MTRRDHQKSSGESSLVWFFVLAGIHFLQPVLALTGPTPPPANALQSFHLFPLSRSQNRNVVLYDVKVDARGYLASPYPIHPYWRDDEIGGKISELTLLERTTVYGAQILDQQKQEVIFYIRALPTQHFRVRRAPEWMATLKLQGQEMKVHQIFVQLKDTFVPAVDYVKLTVSPIGANPSESTRDVYLISKVVPAPRVNFSGKTASSESTVEWVESDSPPPANSSSK